MSTLTKLTSSLVGHLKPNRARERGGALLELPPPDVAGGATLAQALSGRCSQRELSPEPLPLPLLSSLLWAAYGVNRPASGGRTAPSALNAQEVDVYAALPGGLYIYDAARHCLHLVAAVDARRVTGFQDFVDEAPLDLVYVADYSPVRVVPREQRTIFAAVSAGAVSQNVSLFCAATGLASVVRGWLDRAALHAALRLGEHEEVLIAQTVGFPAVSAKP